MANIAGKLSFEEFAELAKPKGGPGNPTSSVEFLISGNMVQTDTGLEPSGDLYIVAVNIPYFVSVGGTVQDNRFTFERLKKLSLAGLLEGESVTLTVKDRILKNDYASFLVESCSISSSLASYGMELTSSDPNNPHWFETESIHSDYKSSKDTGNQGSIEYEPNYINRFYVDDYDVTIGMAQELRGSTGVWVVRTDVPDTGSTSKLVTASIADSYFTDSGIALGHFCGTKHIGEYLSVNVPGYNSASIARRKKELEEIGVQRDPAFMYLTGFSGSIIRDEYTDKDVEAGTINFEELKFSRYRVSGSKDYFEGTQSFLRKTDPQGPSVEVTNSFFAPFENMVCDFERSPSLFSDPHLRRPHQKQVQYFELFTTGSIIDSGSEIRNYTLYTSSRSIVKMWPVPPESPVGELSPDFCERLCNIGSLKLPELCDIIYQPTTGSVYSRVASSMFYVAESNAIYRTDRFGRVYQIDVLTQSGSAEEPTSSSTS